MLKFPYLFRLQKSVNLHSFDRQIEYLPSLLAACRRFLIKNSHADSDVAHRHFVVGFGTLKLAFSTLFLKNRTARTKQKKKLVQME